VLRAGVKKGGARSWRHYRRQSGGSPTSKKSLPTGEKNWGGKDSPEPQRNPKKERPQKTAEEGWTRQGEPSKGKTVKTRVKKLRNKKKVGNKKYYKAHRDPRRRIMNEKQEGQNSWGTQGLSYGKKKTSIAIKHLLRSSERGRQERGKERQGHGGGRGGKS